MIRTNSLPQPCLRSRGGIALVIVLACLVLLSALILAFFLGVRTDLQSSKSYSDNNTTGMLAATSVNVVMAQIRTATTGTGTAWASQPGMIRTFDTTGALSNAYKLYSAGTMVHSGQAALTNDLANEATALGDWNANPALYTDLNEPFVAASGTSWPILTPPPAAMDGYSVSSAAPTTATQPVPMPVSWLYILESGGIVAPIASGSTAVTVPGASGTNRIVGRIAFWTDDETCKVNINTAGGDGVMTSGTNNPTNIANATFWSPPYFCATDEAALATNQPAAGEFQRYPGHPGTVALNNILNGLGWTNLASSGTTGSPNFYTLTPRYSYGGSKAASQSVTSSTTFPFATNRLYATVDEMLFQPAVTSGTRTGSLINTGSSQQIAAAHFFLTAHSRAPELNLFGQPRVSVWPVWDPSAKSGTTVGNPSAIDQLLSFCATSGTAYYFTRKECTDSTVDINLPRNKELLNYLDYLTRVDIPGFGGNFQLASKYGQWGTRQILTEIFDYIRTINIADSTQTATNTASNQYNKPWLPGGYYSGRYQVAPSVNTNWGTQGFGVFPRLTEVAIQFAALGRNTTSGTSATNLHLSSNYTPSKVASLNLAGVGDSGTITLDVGTGTYQTPPNTTAVQAFILLNFIIPAQMRIASMNTGTGYNSASYIYPVCWVEISGLDSFQLNGHSLGFPSREAMMIGNGSPLGDNWGSSNWGIVSFMNQVGCHGANRTIGPGLNVGTRTNVPFYSAILPITVDATSGTGTMSFKGSTITSGTITIDGAITIKLYDGTATGNVLPTPAHLIQTYNLVVRNGDFQVPTPNPTASSIGMLSGTANDPRDRWTATHNSHVPVYPLGSGTDTVIAAGDVIQSMVLSPAWSDPRLLAVSNVPPAAFIKHPSWELSNFANGLIYAEGFPMCNRSENVGTLVAGIANTSYLPGGQFPVNTPPCNYPVVTPSLNNGASSSSVGQGDWDNGLGNAPDGPWINKADEGNVFTTADLPYYASNSNNATGPAFFSPNRQVPSPGMFGSLPTGIDTTGVNPKPWQTLLFRPGPASHPGITSPRDHLLLDLFWMPVAEPYAISEPFSTAGKINLNYQIIPYTYITRSTALRAVLATEKIAKVGATQALKYKANVGLKGVGITGTTARVALNLDATLAQFDDKFNKTNNSGLNSSSTTPDIFRSASQICEMYLVPQGYTTASAFATDWFEPGPNGKFALVGDNVRERPYTDIYGRVTTKSNTYQVHYRVQSLQKRTNSVQTVWDDTKDLITGEKRGATVIERYIDPNASIADFATELTTGTSLETKYQFRILNTTSFPQ